MFTKTVFFIRSKRTGVMWSRNKWASINATPDFFNSRKLAGYQVEQGKVFMLEQYCHLAMEPEIVEATITEIAT